MKMTLEHYEKMASAIKGYLAGHPDVVSEYKAKGLSNKRLNWDVLYAAKVNGDSTRWICDVLYCYLNDDHINSALKSIMGNDGRSSNAKFPEDRLTPN